MAESRIQNAFSRSAVLTVGRLLAFIVVGFAVGLALGVVTEEPGLLAGHLRGDTTTVELDAARTAEVEAQAEAARIEAAAEAEAAADAAAAEEGWSAGAVDSEPLVLEDGGEEGAGLPAVLAGPTESASGQSASSDGATSRGEAAPAMPEMPVAAPVAGGPFAIQVGAFGDAPSADRLAQQLKGKGYPIEVLPAGAESNRWRVRVQPIDDEPSARATAERIEREERLPTWVIRLEGQKRS